MSKNGFYLLNGALCLGAAMMTLGTIYGFIWKGGPIIWGLFGLAAGGIVGFLFDLLFHKNKIKLIWRKNKGPDVFLVIHSEIHQVPKIKEILFDYKVLAVAEIDS